MKYRGIVLLNKEGHSVESCCDLLKVSISGFYRWIKRLPSKRKLKDKELKTNIRDIFENSRKNYGVPRIQKSLERRRLNVGKRRIARLMKEGGWIVRRKKAFRPKTTINNPSMKKSPREFKIESHQVSRPNEVWVSDLTYIPTETQGFIYLVMVMDVFNREIRGWDLGLTMEAKNTKNAFMNAIRSTPGKLNLLIFHSDQGVQYCSEVVRRKLDFLGITQSMSRKGNCYDNAYAESLFSTVKAELPEERFHDLMDAERKIVDYIYWYNRERLHSSLGYKSPMEYLEAAV